MDISRRPWYREYRKLRTEGWQASSAIRHAKIAHKFKHAVFLGLVDLRPVEDDDWSHAIECGCEQRKQCEKENRERAKRMGVWGIVGYTVSNPYEPCDCYDRERCPHMEAVDSVWGFIGDDWKGSGYDTDIMTETLRQLATNTRAQFFTI